MLSIVFGPDPENSEGTIEWAGGETDYTDGPFTMYIVFINITNSLVLQAYRQDGAYTSIKSYSSTISNSASGSSMPSSSSASTKGALSSSAGARSSAASASASVAAYSGASASMYSSLLAASMVGFVAGVFLF
ncbi:concanavalin A-like lectin/glucanase domain-containing protein [Penicillium sp. IBT 16267x]|nr:concanavalin A-like lectin/glucanase domain-containing protein [Penicillium sp. IBT 16267x]